MESRLFWRGTGRLFCGLLASALVASAARPFAWGVGLGEGQPGSNSAGPSVAGKLADRPPNPTTGKDSAGLSAAGQRTYAEGKALFEQICAPCHGFGGEGLAPLAPPLTNSSWVVGTEDRMVRIVLQGLQGPIQVNGTTYQPPRVLPEMPQLFAMEDAQIGVVTSYIRFRWGNSTNIVSPDRVASIRAETARREKAWTEAELLQIK